MVLYGAASRARGSAKLINNVSGNCGGDKKQGIVGFSTQYPRVPKSVACSKAKCQLTLACIVSHTRQTKFNKGIKYLN